MPSFPVRRRTISVAGYAAKVWETGEGPPTVLLASQLVLARTYRPTMRELRTFCRVLTVELPGSGGGSRLPRPWSMQEYAGWAARLLEELNLGPVTVIGHSNAGAVALRLAASHPALVDQLVLVDAIGADEAHSLARVLLARSWDGVLELPLTLRGLPHAAYNLLAHTRNILNQIRLAARENTTDAARRVATPTLVAWGRRDHTMPPRCAERFLRHLPDARLHVSSTGSHDWLVTNPVEFARVLQHLTTSRTGGPTAVMP